MTGDSPKFTLGGLPRSSKTFARARRMRGPLFAAEVDRACDLALQIRPTHDAIDEAVLQ